MARSEPQHEHSRVEPGKPREEGKNKQQQKREDGQRK